MNFFGEPGRNRPPPPTIKKVMMTVPTKLSNTNRIRPTAPAQRFVSTSQKRPQPARPQEPKDRVKRLVKRKSHTPTPVLSSDDDSGDDSSASSLNPNKRARPNAAPVDSNRRIVDFKNRSRRDQGRFNFRHGADLVAGEAGKKYLDAFDDEKAATVELQYPSDSQRESFTLVYNEIKTAKNQNADYQPLDDIRETIKFVCQHYLPATLSDECLNDDTGFERRLIRAGRHGTAQEYRAVIEDYNSIITKATEDGTIRKVLEDKHSLGDLNWVQRILDQVYSRTVSPDIESLRAYEGFSDNVYGELKPRLISEMFQKTNLKSDHVFVDLGSGVGNVVLQAALEMGSESWGIEMMENPCRLAELQREEFAARARLWGLSVGQVHLLKGDFTKNTKIMEVLRRADVVLVNNQAFAPDLNSNLITMFLDLKDGCKIVSLKPFKPEGLELKESNINDLAHTFVDERKESFWSDSVSWTDSPGNYHIVTKDHKRSAEMRDQLLQRGGAGRRSTRVK
ncbi:histone H3 methyltransferase [Delphinella strobiligena]|nr:histone H3 methyltransferase [Delphinella strobiligena]